MEEFHLYEHYSSLRFKRFFLHAALTRRLIQPTIDALAIFYCAITICGQLSKVLLNLMTSLRRKFVKYLPTTLLKNNFLL